MRFSQLCLAAGSVVALAGCDPAELVLRNAASAPCAPCPTMSPAPTPAFSEVISAPPSSRAQIMEAAAVDFDRQNVELRKLAAALAK